MRAASSGVALSGQPCGPGDSPDPCARLASVRAHGALRLISPASNPDPYDGPEAANDCGLTARTRTPRSVVIDAHTLRRVTHGTFGSGGEALRKPL